MNTKEIISALKRHYNFKTHDELGDFLGVAANSISTWIKRDTIDPYLIMSKCEDIDANWLLTGRGRMLKIDASAPNQQDKKLTQFYDAPATAGDSDIDMMPVTQPAGYIDTGELFGTCDAAIRIRGNSMLPGYPSGAILGLNRDFDRFFEPGELYVLETRSKRIFKRLFYDQDDRNIIVCHSDNTEPYTQGPRKDTPFYPNFPVHTSDVIRRFIVVGSAREHSNSILLYRKPLKEANSSDDVSILDQ